MEIVHISSVHYWADTRILHKMCRSLAEAGHRVHFVVPRAGPNKVETRDGVAIHGLPLPKNRWRRVTRTAPEVLRRAAGIRADVYHFHDPELLWYAGAFQRRVGRPLVYDVHEDIRLQVYDKSWLPSRGRRLMSWAVGHLEDRLARRVAGVVTVTPSIFRRFTWHPECVLVRNLPIVDELTVTGSRPVAERPPRIAYVGAIARSRGAVEMAKAITLLPKSLGARLVLVGSCRPPALEDELRRIAGPQIELLGVRDRREVAAVLAEAAVGIVMSQPIRCYREAYPTKLFEYMTAGIPVLACDLPAPREIMDRLGCGLLVDPHNVPAIANAMQWLLEHRQEAQEMGRRGRAAAAARFNWEDEFQVLLGLYDRLTRDHTLRGRRTTFSPCHEGPQPHQEKTGVGASPIQQRRSA